MKNLTVIIPSKTVENAQACVHAIREAGETCRIIIVDDGIAWPPYSYWEPNQSGLRELYSCQIVQGEKPFVFAVNCNLGMAAAGEDDVILCNDDALLRSPVGFTLLQIQVEERPEFGVIGAVTNRTGQPLQMPQKVGLREVPHIAFVCVIIPRRTINKIGMLDERYNQDYGVDDLDYCEMIARAGMKVGVYDYCFVDHGVLQSSFRGEPTNGRTFYKNLALFKEKWGTSLVNPSV